MEPILFYAGGVIMGSIVTILIMTRRVQRESAFTKALVVETISQHAHIRAAEDVVDDETLDEMCDRRDEILEEIDLDVFDVGGESNAE